MEGTVAKIATKKCLWVAGSQVLSLGVAAGHGGALATSGQLWTQVLRLALAHGSLDSVLQPLWVSSPALQPAGVRV